MLTPPAASAAAHDRSVAPVVRTSSTSTMGDSGWPALCRAVNAPSTFASRRARGLRDCGGASRVRLRRGSTGPVPRARATRRGGSSPRRQRRRGWLGTGTIVSPAQPASRTSTPSRALRASSASVAPPNFAARRRAPRAPRYRPRATTSGVTRGSTSSRQQASHAPSRPGGRSPQPGQRLVEAASAWRRAGKRAGGTAQCRGAAVLSSRAAGRGAGAAGKNGAGVACVSARAWVQWVRRASVPMVDTIRSVATRPGRGASASRSSARAPSASSSARSWA
jgi:hypothetical protein